VAFAVALGFAPIGISSADPVEPDASLIYQLIDERLSYMEEVALYKARNHQPIEDREREAVVLAKAVEKAEKLGLDPASVSDFYVAQISAAKAIQYRHRADWLFERGVMERKPRDLTTEVRPALISLGNDLAVAIKEYLAAGGRFAGDQRQAFVARIGTDKLTREEKEILYEALGRIRLLEH
jgi:chorismate mutase